jgi:lysophospholipase L1-like esterase
MKRAALILLFLFAACSPYGRVKNLHSRGSAVIAFGDSLTAGYGAGEGEDWPSRVSSSTNIAIVNAGRSGDTTDSALARLDDDVLARDPRIVIVGLGGNDFLRGEPLSSTESNLRAVVRKIHGQGAMVVLLGFRFPTLNADYEAMYERVAEEEGCLLVKGTLKGILTDPKLKSDQIHPNAAGYALMAERIAGPLKKLIAKADA